MKPKFYGIIPIVRVSMVFAPFEGASSYHQLCWWSLILADEATGNLDPVNKTRILDLLFRSVEDHDTTLLAVTHDHELLPRFDRVVDFRDFGF